MIKIKLIFVISLMIIINISNAQKKWEIGLTLSPGMSKYILNSEYSNTYNSQYNIGAAVGVDFYRLYGENVMLKTGLYFNSKNYDVEVVNYLDNKFSYNRNEYLFTLPLRLQYNFKIKGHNFFVNSGADVSWLLKSVDNDKTTHKKYTNYSNSYEPDFEVFLGIGYMHKINDNLRLTVNPEYSPVIFKQDYSTFRLNFSVIFNFKK